MFVEIFCCRQTLQFDYFLSSLKHTELLSSQNLGKVQFANLPLNVLLVEILPEKLLVLLLLPKKLFVFSIILIRASIENIGNSKKNYY